METFLMNPRTGSVDTYDSWREDYEDTIERLGNEYEGRREWFGMDDDWEDDGRPWNDNLIEVVPNREDNPEYDPAYSDWRPAVEE